MKKKKKKKKSPHTNECFEEQLTGQTKKACLIMEHSVKSDRNVCYVTHNTFTFLRNEPHLFVNDRRRSCIKT